MQVSFVSCHSFPCWVETIYSVYNDKLLARVTLLILLGFVMQMIEYELCVYYYFFISSNTISFLMKLFEGWKLQIIRFVTFILITDFAYT